MARSTVANRGDPDIHGHAMTRILNATTVSFIWARACAESYCRRGDQLHVVTVGPAWRPTAIAPLIRRRGLARTAASTTPGCTRPKFPDSVSHT
jgi:hypothetical protein